MTEDDDHRSADGLARIAELEEVYRSAPVGLCLVDTDLRFRRINERLAAINGHSVEEHLGRTVEEVIPDLAEQIVPRYRKVLATGQPIESVEVTGILPSADDVPRTWLVSDHPVKRPSGRVSGIISVVQDITELKTREREIRTVRARLAEAERVGRLGCWEWNLLTGEQWWSDEIYRIIGYEPGSLAPDWDDFIEHVAPEDRARLREQLEGLYAGAEGVDAEFRITTGDGHERYCHSRATLTRGEDGEPQRLFGTSQDITERHEAEAAFERERAALESEKATLERLLEERTHELDRALDRLRRGKR